MSYFMNHNLYDVYLKVKPELDESVQESWEGLSGTQSELIGRARMQMALYALDSTYNIDELLGAVSELVELIEMLENDVRPDELATVHLDAYDKLNIKGE